MANRSSSEAPVLNLQNPEWIRRHGVTYDWTAVEQNLFEKDFRARNRRRRRSAHRSFKSFIKNLIGVVVILLFYFAAIGLIGVSDGWFETSWQDFVAGVVIGSAATITILVIVSLILRRRSAYSDPTYIFTTVTVGVDCGVLWQYRHGTLALFTSATAFVAVLRTDHHILAFVNKTAAHAFPRDKLASTEEGRMVMEWFDLNWPDPSESEAAGVRTGAIDRCRRGLVLILSGAVRAGLLLVLVLGAVAVWRAGSIMHWTAPEEAPRPNAALVSPRDNEEHPATITLSGRSASEYLGRLANSPPR